MDTKKQFQEDSTGETGETNDDDKTRLLQKEIIEMISSMSKDKIIFIDKITDIIKSMP